MIPHPGYLSVAVLIYKINRERPKHKHHGSLQLDGLPAAAPLIGPLV